MEDKSPKRPRSEDEQPQDEQPQDEQLQDAKPQDAKLPISNSLVKYDYCRVFYDYAIFQVAYLMEKHKTNMMAFISQSIDLDGDSRARGMLWILQGHKQFECMTTTALMLKKMTQTCDLSMRLPVISSDIATRPRLTIDWSYDTSTKVYAYKLGVCVIVGDDTDGKYHWTREGGIEQLRDVLAAPEKALDFDLEVSVIKVRERVEKIRQASKAWLDLNRV